MAVASANYTGIINALTAWYPWDITRPLPWYYRYCWYSMAWWYNSYIHVCIGHHPWPSSTASVSLYDSLVTLWVLIGSIGQGIHGVLDKGIYQLNHQGPDSSIHHY